ncbi:GNAT family N-acetyltransferase [Pseudomonas sp. PAMC 25886]|jgi:ribosomal protein S18 acetylase RimI-like enzyme|uniref:GNAT family N-acetyltransferase n=1 Tax=Pseudomonas sp. PAMC 25886 TaxID=1125977 RepID=UPI00028888C9|nr:GNAT family N-acetyltransferase [Pseudomonas sp. PAMC 25886]
MPIKPNQHAAVTLVRAQQSDLDDLVAIRIDARRESLERVGRFDPVRARERFVSGFEAHNTHYIEVSGERVGFVVVKHHPTELVLDHFYVRPCAQGSGIGSAVLTQIFKAADAAALPIKVGALKESASNRFYIRHGFQFVESTEFDNYYVRQHLTASNTLCPAGEII